MRTLCMEHMARVWVRMCRFQGRGAVGAVHRRRGPKRYRSRKNETTHADRSARILMLLQGCLSVQVPGCKRKWLNKKAASRSRARVQVRKGDGKQPRGSAANVRDEIVATPQDGGAVAQQEPPMPIQQEPPMPMDVEQICVRNASGTPTCAGDFTRPYVYQDDLQPIYPEVPTRSHTPTSSPSSPTTEGA